MPLLKTEAEKLSNNDLEQGIIEEIIDRDAMFALLPFMKVVGKAYVYNRENTLGGADFLDPNEVVPEGAATFTEVTSKLRILIGDVDVDKFLDETMSDTTDQTATQIQLKAKDVARKFRDTLINGDNGANAKEFDGLNVLVTAGQTIDADGAGADTASLSFDMLDELLDLVPNGADVIIMHSKAYRAYKALLRAAGGNTAEHIQLENFTGRPLMGHDGVPIIVNDFIPTDTQVNAKNSTQIYAARFNELDGVHGLYGGPAAGIRLENIGTVQNKDANRFRVKWYCGLALKSTKSLAMLQGVAM